MPRSIFRKCVLLNGLCGLDLANRAASFADENVNSAEGDDRIVDRVVLGRNPTLVVGDDGDVASIEDTPDGDGVTDAC
jgi:hypothetical protein